MASPALFDSHCHLDHPLLAGRLPALLAEAGEAGVAGLLVPGVHPDCWPRIAALARSYPLIFPAFGLHPRHAELVTPERLSQLRRLAPFAVAIGEIGLDYTSAAVDREQQRLAFRAQLRLAAQAGLPVLIHCRRAFGDLLPLLEEEAVGRFGGVMHAFSGSPETAAQCLRLGLHISLAGPVTWENARRPGLVAAMVPLERLLLETDAPDLAPAPHRGRVNLPAYLPAIAHRVAELRGMPVAELAAATCGNARRLFRLAAPPG